MYTLANLCVIVASAASPIPVRAPYVLPTLSTIPTVHYVDEKGIRHELRLLTSTYRYGSSWRRLHTDNGVRMLEMNRYHVVFRVEHSADSPESRGRINICGIAFAFYSEDRKPDPRWTADLIWNPQSKRAYLILSRSVGGYKADFKVYEIDPDRKVVPYPLQVEAGDRKNWPKARPAPIGTYEKFLGPECGIGKLKLSRDGSALIIDAEREKHKCAGKTPFRFRFDLKTKKWSELPAPTPTSQPAATPGADRPARQTP